MSVDRRARLLEEPFSWRATKSGIVFIERAGRVVTTLRGKSTVQFLERIEHATPPERQQILARVTGHYKHGNER